MVASPLNTSEIVSRPPPPVTGGLILEVEPLDRVQIYVDGAYVGTPLDLGNTIDLRPGVRNIELRAPGYRSLAFDAEIVAEKTITYKGRLEPIAPRATATAAAPAPEPSVKKTMYLIPGCYLGNISPKDMQLPAGCDLKRLKTITP